MTAKRIDLGSTARAVYRAIDALDQSVDFDRLEPAREAEEAAV